MMIVAETTALYDTTQADRYDFVGSHVPTEITRVLQAAQGLTEEGAMPLACNTALHEALQTGATHIAHDRFAIHGLHNTLVRYDRGFAAYHNRRNIAWEPMDIDPPIVVGADGLMRDPTETGLEVFLDDPAAIMGDDFHRIAVKVGATHAGYQFTLPQEYRGMNYDLAEHLSVGNVYEGQFRPLLTHYNHVQWPRETVDAQRLARISGTVIVAPQFAARPEQYEMHAQ